LKVEEITVEVVEKAIRNLKNNKAAGTDWIHSELIKYRRYKLLNRIYELIRQIWEEERIPAEWKETIIVPIHQREDKGKCENYRKIALGNSLIKCCRILEKIKPCIEKIMGAYQNGLRDGRSVIDNIFALKTINKKIRVYNIYLLISRRHLTLYIKTRYGNLWKNLKSLKN
jgi:hypothetical protein